MPWPSRALLTLALFSVLSVLPACRPDPGIDIVRVPPTAYLAADAAVATDGARVDAGPAAAVFMLCIEAPPPDGQPNDGKPDDDEDDDANKAPTTGESDTNEDMSSDFPDCPNKYQGRNLDLRVTKRHRDKDDEKACCYRIAGSRTQPLGGSSSGGE